MTIRLAVEIAVIAAACLVAAFAFRARVAQTRADAQTKAIEALSDAVDGLEHKLRVQEQHYKLEIAQRDKRIAALEAQVAQLQLHVGEQALIDIKDHVDMAADRIVLALQEGGDA